MFLIGCHLSASKGYLAMAKQAKKIGANTFQYFTRNPRGGVAKPLDLEDIEKFKLFSKENGISNILAHAPYTINPCALDEKVREFAILTLKDDILRLENLDNSLYNLHPGSHVKQGVDVGIEKIIETLNIVMFKGQKTTVLLETMAGKGSEIGSNFTEIRRIIDGIEVKERIGVCLDTCHIWDAGYDIFSNLDKVLQEFDNIIGLDLLKAIHLNDSKNLLSSHKDRHECIGKGTIGIETFRKIINHPKLKDLPFFLETPQEKEEFYAEEIALLKDMYVE